MSSEAEYGMVQPFWIDTDAYTDRDRQMFVCGVEFEMVHQLLEAGVFDHQRKIPTENESRLRMLCGRYPIWASFMSSEVEGWTYLQWVPKSKA